MHKAKNHAKVRLQEIRDHGGQVLTDFVAHYKLNVDNDQELKEKAEAAAADVLKAEYETKKKQRLPFVIVPAAPLNMGIDDKDGNGVHSLACYKN
jgi:hypothetical protein